MASPPTKRTKNRKSKFDMPPLTSLMDAITILTFFLLTQMSASTVLNPIVPNMALSTSQVDAEKGILFGLDKYGFYYDKGTGGSTDQRKVILADPAQLMSPDVDIPNFRAMLEEEKAKFETRRIPLPSVTVEIDSMVEYNWVLKVINTVGLAEYSKMNFVVLKADKL
ncbi:MAG: biopolymer transporter ExbD [bacterium]|nr:biopolymer transporter ExbD [bacterium]